MEAPQENLQYPIGRFRRPEDASPARVAGWVEEIADLPTQLRAAVEGFTDSQLDTAYRTGGWTLRQVVHHLADSHMNAYVRVRIVVTEPQPTVRPYDEQAWARLPDAQFGPIDVSLRLLDALHERWAALGRALTPEQLASVYHHPEHGKPRRLDATLAEYAWHGKHHVAHVTSLRERKGW